MIKRPEAGLIPDAPGSYLFKDSVGRVIYVGKAVSLKQRLSSYFSDPATLHPKTARMVESAESVEWVQVRNESEAMLLEYNLIKQHKPRYNVAFRDDKSYPFLAITLGDEWPRAMIKRSKRKPSERFFGPYASAYSIRETLDLILRTFPIRTCSDGKFNYHKRLGRPCLLFHIEKCSGPCVGEVEKSQYDEIISGLSQFLQGNTKPVLNALELQMKEAADHLDFEWAARLRDRISSVERAIEKQQVIGDETDDIDVIAMANNSVQSCVQIFHVRAGRVLGRRGFMVERDDDFTMGDLLSRVVLDEYAEADLALPKEILVPELPDEAEVLSELLAEKKGTRVKFRVPQRGEKKSMLELVTQNAQRELKEADLKRGADHNSRAKSLNELRDHLNLPEAPLRIECFDMSHLQGTEYVGSMVVFEDGAPRKSEYRRFKVKEVEGNDDFGAMEEVLRRRFTALIGSRQEPTSANSKFAYPPQLLVVDGGRGQLNVGVRVLAELGLDNEIAVIGLAKRFEEVYTPYEDEPLRLPRSSEALFLLQRLRDEAHRFAITFHRSLRNKSMTRSELDDIGGLGPGRKARLLDRFGSIAAIKKASLAELEAVPGLPKTVAETVYSTFH